MSLADSSVARRPLRTVLAVAMGPLAFISELCTLDSAFIRGWRWLLSAGYRQAIRIRCAEGRTLLVIAGVLETILLMLAEVAALGFIVLWLLRV
jgi:hypothetical protein